MYHNIAQKANISYS